MPRVNLSDVELDHVLDEAGFAHRGTALPGTEERRIGAAVYEARAGAPIWPYHYHHGEEEWVLVLDGTPLLREPAGRRTLTPVMSSASRPAQPALTRSPGRAGS